jgi:hypothetical protein
MALAAALKGRNLGTLVGAAKKAFPASDNVLVGMGRGRRALPSGARAIDPPPRMHGPAIPMGPGPTPTYGPAIPMGRVPYQSKKIPVTARYRSQPIPIAATPPPKQPGFFAQHGKKVAAAVAVGAVGFGAMNNRSGKAVDPQTGLPRGIYGR